MKQHGFDPMSLVAGLAVCGLGALLLLDQLDVIALSFGYAVPALLATVGVILLGSGLFGRR
jgi:multidrug transporter EmrE-like cation transporter